MVADAITPQAPGRVRIAGELWRATATEAIPANTPVVVEAVEGLELRVRPADVPLQAHPPTEAPA